MNVRKLAMCVVVLFAITMGVPVVAGDASMDVVASAGLSCKTNLCDEIGQLAEKAFVVITRDRDYSAIRQFVSRVVALTGGGYQIDERAYEAFLDLLKRLIDFHSDDQEIRLSGILDYQEFEDIEDGDLPSSSMFTGMKRRLVQELQQSDS